MKQIVDNVVIQIEVTNACNLSCTNCSRLVGHHKKPFFMSLDEVRSAIGSLKGYAGRIGLMGGEPTLHPQFAEICKIYQELIPDKRKRELWTDGFRWDEYNDLIFETFDKDLIHYNDHSKPEEGWHQPILISIDEVVADKEKMWRLIDNCWVQRRWSASITPKGAFFCEVAAAIDHAFDGPGGWPVEEGWYTKKIESYREQKEFSCLKCSAAIPMAEIPNNHERADLVSEDNLIKLKDLGSPKVRCGRAETPDKKAILEYLDSSPLKEGERGYWQSHPEWRPSEFRSKVWHAPGEGTLSPKEVLRLQKEGVSFEGKEIRTAEIRERDIIFDEARLKSAAKELNNDVLAILKDCKGLCFSEESSFVEFVNTKLDRELEVREMDLLLKFGTDDL